MTYSEPRSSLIGGFMGTSDDVPEGEYHLYFSLANLLRLLAGISISSLLDVELTLLLSGQVLRIGGLVWRNEKLKLHDLLNVSDTVVDAFPGQALIFLSGICHEGYPSLKVINYNNPPLPSLMTARLVYAVDSLLNKSYLGYSTGNEWLFKVFP